MKKSPKYSKVPPMVIAGCETREGMPTGIPTIRSHHLVFAGWAMGLGARAGTPESVAAGFTKTVLEWRNSKEPYLRRYARTTVGRFGQTADKYRESLGAGLREFVDAPDSQRFTIVEEIPDSIICGRMQSCQLADHCRRRQAPLSDGTLGELGEANEMSLFLIAARELGVSWQIEDGWSEFVDAKQILIRKVTLTAGEVRKVLRFMAQPENGFAYYFNEPQWEF